MSAIAKDIQSNPTLGRCKKYLKDDLISAARYLKVSSTGTKDDICNAIIASFSKREIGEAKVAIEENVKQATHQASNATSCMNYKVPQLRAFLASLHKPVGKMLKADMCAYLDDQARKGLFRFPSDEAKAEAKAEEKKEARAVVRAEAREEEHKQPREFDCDKFTSVQLKEMLQNIGMSGISKLTTKDARCKALKAHYKGAKAPIEAREAREARVERAEREEKREEKKVSEEIEEKRPLQAIIPTRMNELLTKSALRSQVAQLTYVQAVLANLPRCASVLNSLKQGYSFETAMQHVLNDLARVPTYQQNRADDVAQQQFMQCFVRDMFTRATDQYYRDGTNTFSILNNDIKKYLRLQQIGEESKNGVAFLSYVRTAPNSPPIAVTKLMIDPNSSEEYMDQLHELAIGFALNTLRSTIPNFTYTYGGYYCNALQATDGPKCDSRREKDMILLSMQEYIKGGVDAEGFLVQLKTKSKDEQKRHIYNHLCQVAHALYIAEKQYKFVHLDLHAQNILIVRTPSPVNMTLRSDKYNIELRGVEYVPYIIDYGMSVMKVNGKIFHNLQRAEPTDDNYMTVIGFYDDYYYPSFDIYRYLVDFLVDVGYEVSTSLFSELRTRYLDFFVREINRVKPKNYTQFLNGLRSSLRPMSENHRVMYGYIMDKNIWKKDCGDWLASLH